MSKNVLLLGGHGKISLLMTPLLLRSWNVTSIVRNADHVEEIKSLAKGTKGKLDVLVRSLDDVTSEDKAKTLIDETKPDYVVWSAGAGGKGGATRTNAIDRDAARYFIKASVQTPSVKKFLLVSFTGSRRNRPSWWSDEDWAYNQKVFSEILPDYAKAKVDADECLAALSKHRGGDFQGIDLRPGTLEDGDATGKVAMGKISPRGKVRRADVAEVAVKLLERNDTRGYWDLLGGEESVSEALDRVVNEKIDAFEGEDEDGILKKYTL